MVSLMASAGLGEKKAIRKDSLLTIRISCHINSDSTRCCPPSAKDSIPKKTYRVKTEFEISAGMLIP